METFDLEFYKSTKRILTGIFNLLYNPEVNGLENIPDKPYILAGNHKSLLDIPLLITAIDDDIHFMAKKELFNIIIFRKILAKMGAFPVNRESVDIKAIKTALSILRNNDVLGIFPEGTRNKTDDVILPFKKGVTNIAAKTNSLIVPFGISGRYRRGDISLNIGEAIDICQIEEPYRNEALEESVTKLILKR